MRIEFDPTNPDEAAAVRAMITAMHPTYPGTNLPLMQGREITKEDYEWPAPTPLPATFPEGANVTLASGDPEPIKLGEGERRYMADTDSTGTPWDARIHSTPATTNKDGTWRAKRGVTAEQIAQVRAEREQAEADENSGPIEIKPEDFKAHVEEMTNGAATVDSSGEVVRTAPPAPTPPSGQSEAPLAPDASTVTEAEKSTEQTVSGSAPVPPAPPSATTTTEVASTHGSEAPISPSFLDVMKAITAAQKDGKIDTAKVKELCAAVGAGESTMGLNGPDNGDKRVAFMALLASEVVS